MGVDNDQINLTSLVSRRKKLNQADRLLLLKIASGSEAAFDSFYQQYGTSIYNYILRLIHETAPAEEITQEVFLAVWTGASAFSGRASVKTWLFKIAHNQAVSWLRKIKPLELLDKQHTLATKDPKLEEKIDADLQLEHLRLALDRLPFNHRATIELAFVHGLSYREIAEIMNCPIGTVKSRNAYALRQLKRLLVRTNDEN